MLDKKVGVKRSDAEMIDIESWGIQHLISKKRDACITAMCGGEKIDDFAQDEHSKVETGLDIRTYLMKVT